MNWIFLIVFVICFFGLLILTNEKDERDDWE